MEENNWGEYTVSQVCWESSGRWRMERREVARDGSRVGGREEGGDWDMGSNDT